VSRQQKCDSVSGKIEYKPNGSPMKIKVRMTDTHLADGTLQPLYFPEGHERAGVFKGMATILQKRGFDLSKKRVLESVFKHSTIFFIFFCFIYLSFILYGMLD